MRVLPLLLMIPAALSATEVAISWQEARVTRAVPSAQGLAVQAEVRDRCDYEVFSFRYSAGVDGSDVVCTEWRALSDTDPERRLTPTHLDDNRPIRGPVLAPQPHVLALDVTAPSQLRGSVFAMSWEDGEWRLKAADLGSLLLIADARGLELSRMQLRIVGQLGAEQPVDILWELPGYKAPTTDYRVELEGAALERLAPAWRCAGLAAHPDPGLASLELPLSQRIGLVAGACEEGRERHRDALCTELAAGVEAAEHPADALALRQTGEPLWESCSPTTPLTEGVHRLYEDALEGGDLDEALELVEVFGPEMGAEWSGPARDAVEERVRATVPNRFDWAVQNRSAEQATALLERYGAILGPDWQAEAQAAVADLQR